MSNDNAIAGYGPTTRGGWKPRGQLYRRTTKRPPGVSYGVRFRWNGERLFRSLGHSKDGWTKANAEKEIERLMAALWAGAVAAGGGRPGAGAGGDEGRAARLLLARLARDAAGVRRAERGWAL